ncbi:hypothetical protein HY032_02980, partial [Candidatus Gottesmanbacteria bacterium]|nr:hypothetical protein [Candidatus Gottesmanbacteria bacterium]
VITDHDDNQIGSFYVGAMKYAKELSVGTIQGVALHGKATPYENFVVMAPNDPTAMKKYVKECRSHNLPYLYDPAFQIATFSPDELKEGIEGAALLIGNDYEIALIEQRLEISHEKLLAMTSVVITTLGAKGSVIETTKEAIHIKPAKPKNTSDPTGAGDAYRAGFLAGYLKVLASRPRLEATLPPDALGTKPSLPGTRPGLEARISADELLVCGQMGSVAAVYTVEKYGTQTHTFTKKEFCKRYEKNFGAPITL